MECPDANELQELMSGQLAGPRRAAVMAHLDGCAECRDVVAIEARGGAAEGDGAAVARGAGFAETQAPVGALGVAVTVESGSSVAGARMELLAPGQKIGRYVIAARLGAGAMGVVYSATDPELGREVAIKLLRRPDPMLRDRLGREARAMAQVSHPNVVAVYDVGTIADQVYVAMELVRGQTLRQWQTAKPRSPSELVEVYAAAGRGLAAAHAAGVVHRDFKPDNVLIGEDGRPRVTDFGLAGAVARARPSAGASSSEQRRVAKAPRGAASGLEETAAAPPAGEQDRALGLEETVAAATPSSPSKQGEAGLEETVAAAKPSSPSKQGEAGLEETAAAATPSSPQAKQGEAALEETALSPATSSSAPAPPAKPAPSAASAALALEETVASSPASSSAAAEPSTPGSFDVSLTQTGVVLGTPVYMSPEQFEGGNVDPRSDQWAFCVSLHEALFGKRPFSGGSWEELQDRVTRGAIEPVGPSKVSPALRRIVHRGLSVRPGGRHATMDELIAELGRDRGTPWRRAAIAGGLVAAIFAIGVAADALLRQRAEEATTETFKATGGQLERSVALRYESFVALADASYSVPVMHKVLGHKDQADFGFGDEGADTENLALVHDALISADWIAWAQRSSRATIAVGDYKGRLLFTSADPERWGADLLVLSAARAAFDGGRRGEAADPSGGSGAVDDAESRRSGGAMVARYDDPRVAAAQLYGSAVPAGLAVIFARSLVVGGVPLGMFVQAIDGRQLLADVSVGEDVLLSLVAPDGSSVGRAPLEVTRAAAAAVSEVRAGGGLYLVQARPLQGLDGKGAIATLVLARAIDPGLSGLFASARTVFAIAALLLLGFAIATGLRARALALIR